MSNNRMLLAPREIFCLYSMKTARTESNVMFAGRNQHATQQIIGPEMILVFSIYVSFPVFVTTIKYLTEYCYLCTVAFEFVGDLIGRIIQHDDAWWSNLFRNLLQLIFELLIYYRIAPGFQLFQCFKLSIRSVHKTTESTSQALPQAPGFR